MSFTVLQYIIVDYIEFAKLVLFMNVFFGVRPRKTFYIAPIFIIPIFTWLLDVLNISGISPLHTAIVVLIVILFSHEHNRIQISIISSLLINSFDMIILLIITGLSSLGRDFIENHFAVDLLFCCCSLCILAILFALRNNLKINILIEPVRRTFIIYILVIVLLQLIATVIQFLILGDSVETYRDILIAFMLGCIILMIVFSALFLDEQSKFYKYKSETETEKYILKAEKDYFDLLLRKEEDIKSFRHDINGHITIISQLFEEKKYEELENYLSETKKTIYSFKSELISGSVYVDALIKDFSAKYQNIGLNWSGKLKDSNIAPVDMCTLFYNLLKNAFEATEEARGKEINVTISRFDCSMIINFKNPYSQINLNKEKVFETTKGEGHGYGIKNINSIVKKYSGEYKATAKNGMFETNIIFTDILS